MTPSSAAALLARLEAQPLSAPDDPLGFESRLADEQGWTLGRALVVAQEYRRFLVLTQVSADPVCPSDEVDQAWHLHITRTADYARFCAALPGGFLHHVPARTGADERERHRAMYAATLALYRRVFDRAPPPAAWPAAAERFAAAPPRARAGAGVARLPGVAVLVGAVVVGWMAGRAGLLAPLRIVPGSLFLLLVLAALVAIGWRGLRGGDRTPRDADVLDPYEAAWLVGGTRRVAASALATLVDRGALALRPGADRKSGTCTRLAVAGEPPHPVERACVCAVAPGSALSFDAAFAAVEPQAAAIRRRLVAAGLAPDGRALSPERGQAVLLAGALLALMVGRIVQGEAYGRPTGLLTFLAFAGGALVLLLASRSGQTTARGAAVLRALERRLRGARAAVPGRAAPGRGGADVAWLLPMSLALFGGAAIAGDARFDHLERAMGRDVFARPPTSGGDGGSGCSSGSGCSGGGDGGGGGCGGCGGGGGD